MLSLRKCREILGPRCTLSDEDLEALRDQLYLVAEISLEAFCFAEEPMESGTPPPGGDSKER